MEFGAINQGFSFREKIGHFFGPCEMLLVYIFRWWAISTDLRFATICKSANFGSNHQFCPKPRPRMAGISLHHFICNCGTFCSYCRYVAKISVTRYFYQNITNFCLDSSYWYNMRLVGLRLRTALASSIYKKSLRLSNASRKAQTGWIT